MRREDNQMSFVVIAKWTARPETRELIASIIETMTVHSHPKGASSIKVTSLSRIRMFACRWS